ncbi:lysophospholipid acyltransferase family protein [Algiphilus aromaticivorans]|uniref:lysophospholipid acyltransferase family protein n=1 Tax=Algiphilus aromaticivorans TaxID=382454 RepID=UPI0005C1BA66|nr:lysophospholipid acyltransferase family protein [Algiphilus aromaticivorans]
MRVLMYTLAWLPLPLLQGFGALAAWLMRVTNASRWRVALFNLQHCMPERDTAERKRIAKASLRHELTTYIETARYWLGPGFAVKRAVREWRNIEVLDEAFAQGRGVILLTLHMGAFEAVAIPMSARYPFYGLYKPQKGVFNALSLKGRCRFGGRMQKAEAGVRRAALPLLEEGFGVYYMPDHDPPEGRGVFVPFMGQLAHTPTLIARMVAESGAPVVFMWGERLSRARGYIAHYLPAPEGVYSSDITESTAAMNAGLEACVRQRPEQYWWSYKRFRRQPEGSPTFYEALRRR